MNFMLLICAITASMVAGNPAPVCLSEYDTISKCLEDNGLSLDAMFNVMIRIMNITGEDFRKMCQERPQQYGASLCVLKEFSRCSYKVPRHFNETVIQIDILCNDLNIKIDCILDVLKKVMNQEICQVFPLSRSTQSASTEKGGFCEVNRYQAACSVNAVKECDRHTGVIYEGLSNIAVAQSCDSDDGS